MKLFDRLPDNFFSLLSSKNKDIYVDALFVLRGTYKENVLIYKDELVSRLISSLEDKMMDMEEEDMPEDRSTSSIAYFLIKRLKNTSWIDIEYKSNTFDEIIIVYDYSLKVMNLLYDLVNVSQREYNGYVYNTYSSLKTANDERNDYMYTALKGAYDNTSSLVDELKGLSNEIRNYSKKLVEKESIQDVLVEHFDSFKELISDKIYYPLKTFDSVPRFKGPIVNILKDWLYDDAVKEKIIDTALRAKVYKDREEAFQVIEKMIGDILTYYEGMDELVNEVDRKNTSYIRASEEKIRYLLNTDRSIKGKLVEILKFIQKDINRVDKIKTEMSMSSCIFNQGFLDEASLYIRKRKEIRDKSQMLKIDDSYDETAFEFEIKEFLERMNKSFSHERIIKFMEEQFEEKNTISSSDISINSDEDFIMTIYASLKYNEKNTFYRVEFLKGYLLNGGYRMPYIKFIRKKEI